MFAKSLRRATLALALITPLTSQAQEIGSYWTKDRLRDAKIASFDAETLLDEGRRLAALETLAAVLPDDVANAGIPADLKPVLALLQRAFLGHWVRLNGRHAFDFAMLSPDRTHLLTQKTLTDGLTELVLWNTGTGAEITRLTGNYKVSQASLPAFSNDGTTLALMYDEGTLDLHSTASGARLYRISALAQPDNVDFWYGRLQFSPDDTRLLVTGGDHRNPFAVVDTTRGTIAYTLFETGPHPALNFTNGVQPYKPGVLPFRMTINVAMLDATRLCFTLTEAAERDDDWRTNEIENLYSGVLDLAANSVTFDAVLEGRRLADEALECHPNGVRLIKSVIDPELAQEDEFDEGGTLISDGRTLRLSRENTRWMGGFAFSRDGSRALLSSNRPAIIDTSSGAVLTVLAPENLSATGKVSVIDAAGGKIGRGFTLHPRESLYQLPLMPADLLAAVRAELAARR